MFCSSYEVDNVQTVIVKGQINRAYGFGLTASSVVSEDIVAGVPMKDVVDVYLPFFYSGRTLHTISPIRAGEQKRNVRLLPSVLPVTKWNKVDKTEFLVGKKDIDNDVFKSNVLPGERELVIISDNENAMVLCLKKLSAIYEQGLVLRLNGLSDIQAAINAAIQANRERGTHWQMNMIIARAADVFPAEVNSEGALVVKVTDGHYEYVDLVYTDKDRMFDSDGVTSSLVKISECSIDSLVLSSVSYGRALMQKYEAQATPSKEEQVVSAKKSTILR